MNDVTTGRDSEARAAQAVSKLSAAERQLVRELAERARAVVWIREIASSL